MNDNQVDAPMIWTRRPKILEPNREIVVGGGAKMRGFFKLEAVRPDGRRRLLADWFPNLITDAGLNLIGTSQSWLSFCRVGTGSTTPAVTDTALQSHVAETATLNGSRTLTAQGSAPYYAMQTVTFRFAQGAAAGNLAEIGIADQGVASSTDVLFSRALILDSSGDPTTITVLSDEFLDATYQIRFYPPASDVVHVVNISGTDYTITERAALVTAAASWAPSGVGFDGGINSVQAYDGAIGAVTSSPSGTTAFNTSITPASYGNNNLYRDATSVWGLSTANFAGGIDSFMAVGGRTTGGGGSMQFGVSPAISKISSTILTLIFRHTWGRGQS